MPKDSPNASHHFPQSTATKIVVTVHNLAAAGEITLNNIKVCDISDELSVCTLPTLDPTHVGPTATLVLRPQNGAWAAWTGDCDHINFSYYDQYNGCVVKLTGGTKNIRAFTLDP